MKLSKKWIGKAIASIGILHTALGFVFGWSIFRELLNDGLFNTVNGQMDREFFFWFTMFGVILFLFGALASWAEQTIGQLPIWMAWACFVLTIVMVFIMPISGAWLMLIPTIGLLLQHRNAAASMTT